MTEKYLVVINPTGLQALNLSEIIPLAEHLLKKRLKWYLISFGGIMEEDLLNIDLSQFQNFRRQELLPSDFSKFDFGPYCEFHEGSVVGLDRKTKLPLINEEEFLVSESEICISFDHLNTAAIFAKNDLLIDELTKALTNLDRYPYIRDSTGQKIELPVLEAEGVARSE